MRCIAFLILIMTTTFSNAQNKPYKLSTHVLNTYEGIPGEGVKVQLYKQNNDTEQWILIDEKITDHDGRVNDFLDKKFNNEGIYKLKFFAKEYFMEKYKQTSIFPYIEVIVEISEELHYHIPITVAPLSYGTYKGR